MPLRDFAGGGLAVRDHRFFFLIFLLDVYEYHKLLLQFLTKREMDEDVAGAGAVGAEVASCRRWLLKTPFHSFCIL